MDSLQIKNKVISEIEKIRTNLIQLAEKIHFNPEVSGQEINASRWISEYLERNGFDVQLSTTMLSTQR